MNKLLRSIIFLTCAFVSQTFAQSINLTTSAYTQDFNTLAVSGTSTVLPNGWYFLETGTSANATYTAGTGSSTTGDTYSFGQAGNINRALGSLLSGSVAPSFGASFTNTTANTITQLTITYTGQTYRVGAASRTDRLDFSYSTDATALNNGTFTNVSDLNYTNNLSAVTTGNGTPLQSANISYTIQNLSIAPNQVFWIKFMILTLRVQTMVWQSKILLLLYRRLALHQF